MNAEIAQLALCSSTRAECRRLTKPRPYNAGVFSTAPVSALVTIAA